MFVAHSVGIMPFVACSAHGRRHTLLCVTCADSARARGDGGSHGICDLKTQLTSSPFGFHGPRRAETRVDARTDRSERPLARAPAGGQHPRDIVAQTWLRGASPRLSASPIESRLRPARPVATRRRTAAPTVTPTEGAPRRIRSDMAYARYPLGGRHWALTLTASRCELPR